MARNLLECRRQWSSPRTRASQRSAASQSSTRRDRENREQARGEVVLPRLAIEGFAARTNDEGHCEDSDRQESHVQTSSDERKLSSRQRQIVGGQAAKRQGSGSMLTAGQRELWQTLREIDGRPSLRLSTAEVSESWTGRSRQADAVTGEGTPYTAVCDLIPNRFIFFSGGPLGGRKEIRNGLQLRAACRDSSAET